MKIFKMESGRLAGWLAIALVGAALISGLALLASGLPRAIRNNEPWPTMKVRDGKDLSFDASRGFPGADVNEVAADFSFEMVRILPSPDADFHVRYSGAARGIEDWEDVFTMELREEVLFIDSHWRGIPPLGGVTAEIQVPAGFDGILRVGSGSGRLEAEGVSAGSLDIRLASGSLHAGSLRAGQMSLRTASGGLTVDSLQAEELTLRAISGSIRGGGLTADRTDVKSASGRTVLDDVSGSLVLDGSSGSVAIVFTSPGDLIDVKVASGSIDLTLPAGTGFSLDASSSSGRVDSDFPVTVTGSLGRNKIIGDAGSPGGRTVRLRTASGSIDLRAK